MNDITCPICEFEASEDEFNYLYYNLVGKMYQCPACKHLVFIKKGEQK